jgi:hypothetical protein
MPTDNEQIQLTLTGSEIKSFFDCLCIIGGMIKDGMPMDQPRLQMLKDIADIVTGQHRTAAPFDTEKVDLVFTLDQLCASLSLIHSLTNNPSMEDNLDAIRMGGMRAVVSILKEKLEEIDHPSARQSLKMINDTAHTERLKQLGRDIQSGKVPIEMAQMVSVCPQPKDLVQSLRRGDPPFVDHSTPHFDFTLTGRQMVVFYSSCIVVSQFIEWGMDYEHDSSGALANAIEKMTKDYQEDPPAREDQIKVTLTLVELLASATCVLGIVNNTKIKKGFGESLAEYEALGNFFLDELKTTDHPRAVDFVKVVSDTDTIQTLKFLIESNKVVQKVNGISNFEEMERRAQEMEAEDQSFKMN